MCVCASRLDAPTDRTRMMRFEGRVRLSRYALVDFNKNARILLLGNAYAEIANLSISLFSLG